MKMQKTVHSNIEELGKSVAHEIYSIMQSNPNANIGLATGSTPIPIYRHLVLLLQPPSTQCNLANIHTFNLDEYLGLESTHCQSYRSFMNTHLFACICKSNNYPNGLLLQNTSFPTLDNQYDDLIRSKGGLDILLLGIGLNGHIGFNEPGTYFIFNDFAHG
jgi:glucosamine-6-phosphate deaminase